MPTPTPRPLTALQAQVLGAVDAAGNRHPTVARLVLDVRGSSSSVRSAANTLERRGLVAATYSGGPTLARAYVITNAGRAALAAAFPDDDEDTPAP